MVDDWDKTFGGLVRCLRERKRWTRQELGDKTAYTARTIRAIETNDSPSRKKDSAEAFAAAFSLIGEIKAAFVKLATDSPDITDYESALLDNLYKRELQPQSHPPSAPLPPDPFPLGSAITNPRQFFGRKRELKEIFGVWQISPIQHRVIIGARRSGKSSLLHYLKLITQTQLTDLRPHQKHNWLRNPHAYRWVFVDFQNPLFHTPSYFLSHLLRGFGYKVDASHSYSIGDFLQMIDANPFSGQAIILMDEASAILDKPQFDELFWGGMRSFISNSPKVNIGCIATAHYKHRNKLTDFVSISSPFWNVFQFLELGAFTQDESLELITSSPNPFPADDIEWILQQSGCWPALLQIICGIRLRALAEKEPTAVWQEEALERIEPYQYLLKYGRCA